MSTVIPRSYGALRAGLAALAAVVLAAGCGGSGSENMPASGRASTQGTITGFGSIIVNGVRFDDSSARVIDDDDQLHNANDLKLGMNVEIESSDIDRRSMTAAASQVRFGAAIVGPVSAISAASTPKTLTVLDQIVEIAATTVFDDSLPSGFDSIKVGDVLEIHALLNTTTGHYLAKRQLVRVRLQTLKNAAGAWVAIAIRAEQREMEDQDEAEVRGTITDFTSVTSFSVNGLPVDASKAQFPEGTAGIVKGAAVEV